MQATKQGKTFRFPNKLVRNEQTGMMTIDEKESENFVLLEAIGTPKVFYAQKANIYFKDEACTKKFADAELNALGLPLPAAIDGARRKLIKEANESGTLLSYNDLYAATSPTEIKPPEAIASKLINQDPLEKSINKLNRATLAR